MFVPEEVRPLKEPVAGQKRLETRIWPKQRCIIAHSQRNGLGGPTRQGGARAGQDLLQDAFLS